ncbi:MAG: hypothetical protein WKG06_43020 [Segetibacter sp.]
MNRAVAKIESERYEAELKLLESQKSLSQVRFYILIAILVIAALLFNRYRLKKLHQMKLAEIEKERIESEKQQAEEKLKQAEALLMAYLDTIKEKTSLIESLDIELQRLKETANNTPDLHGIAANRESSFPGLSLLTMTGDVFAVCLNRHIRVFYCVCGESFPIFHRPNCGY